MKKKPLIVFGTGQQSDIISFYLKKMSRKIELYCVDDNHLKGNSFNKKGIISTTTLLKKYKPKDYNMHIAISYSELNSIRSKKYSFFKKKGYFLENVVNNFKLFNTSKKIGENVVVLDSHIQPYSKIGNNTFIWSGSIIGHHTNIGDNCWISSGVAIGGNCKVKNSSFFGMNATVGHFVDIGESCFIGSSAHITKKVKSNSVVINPDSKKLSFDVKKFLEIKKFK